MVIGVLKMKQNVRHVFLTSFFVFFLFSFVFLKLLKMEMQINADLNICQYLCLHMKLCRSFHIRTPFKFWDMRKDMWKVCLELFRNKINIRLLLKKLRNFTDKQLTWEFFGLRKWNFQGIAFICTQTYTNLRSCTFKQKKIHLFTVSLTFFIWKKQDPYRSSRS